jgi:hypothetical protein
MSEGALQILLYFKNCAEIISNHTPLMRRLEYGAKEEMSRKVGVVAHTNIIMKYKFEGKWETKVLVYMLENMSAFCFLGICGMLQNGDIGRARLI